MQNIFNNHNNTNFQNNNTNKNKMQFNQNMNMCLNNQNINRFMMMNNNFMNMGMNAMNNNINNNNFIPNNMNINNQFNNNMVNNNNLMQNSANLKMKLLNESRAEKDPYKFQMKIALGLNNNKSYEHYVAGGNQVPAFFKQSTFENSPMGIDNKINVVFKTMQGNKHTRFFNRDETIEGMLLKFLDSVGLQKYHLKKIYFLFNAINLTTINVKQTIYEYGFRNNSTITVIDLKNIIGA